MLEKCIMSLAVAFCVILHVVAGLKVFPTNYSSNPIVETNVGTIRGLRSEDGTYSMFMGIPYAQVNQSNIFGPAIPNLKFEGIFDANNSEAKCPQREEIQFNIVGLLDCLHLNVYVPNNAATKNGLPVLIWIYGGAFQIGYACRYIYGPRFIVRHDIILVTFNYRLGPYGFFCLDIPEVAGNQGLKDQVLALRWVKNNIKAFGGDVNQITVGGHSTGATCLHLHSYYLKEKLFHRIILQSPLPSLEDIFVERDLNQPIRLANNLNYSTTDVKDALAFLSQVDPKILIAASLKLKLTYSPCVEKKFVNADNYITDHLTNVKLPDLKEIDVLTGITNDETNMFPLTFTLSIYTGELNPIKFVIQNHFDFGENTDVFNEMEEIVKQFYFGDEDSSFGHSQNFADMVSDFSINYQVMRTVKTYLKNGVTNMYFYIFSYFGERNYMSNLTNIKRGGAVHADELGYLFDISYMNNSINPADKLIVDRFTELWTNFVKYGNPTPAPTKLVPLSWPRVTLKKTNFLQMDTDLRVIPNPLHARMAFLDLFYDVNKMYYKHLKQNVTLQQFRQTKNVTDGSSMLCLNVGLLFLVSISFSL